MKILVVTEQRQGKWNNTSFETLVAAQQIAAATAGTITAAVVGKNVTVLAEELATKNVAEVLAVENELLENYTPDGYCMALKQVVESTKPDLVLFPHTYQVRDFAPKLAAMLGRGMVGDCVGFRKEGDKLIFVRQMFQGKTAADVSFVGAAPWFASFQSGAFRADMLEAHAAGKAPVSAAKVELKAEDIRTKPLELFKEAKASVDLTQAPLIVAIGRGIKAPENIAQAEAVAKALGGRNCSVAPDLRRRLAADGTSDRQFGPNRCAEAVSGAGHQRGDSTRRGNEGLAHDRRRKQRSECAHLRNSRLWNRRRYLRNHARPHRRTAKSQGLA